ncbi:MAG: efflux RND transporter periplasmic adaptor subunit [Ignavibacteriales bacterium]|nr:efflux RND transporter periplasmic adaptor subunit [Ignavibacteriales bacterium]
MKYFITFTLALLLASCGSKEENHKDHADSSATAEAKDVYTCPMHPSVVSDRPGACPVCGMALVKKYAQTDVGKEELKNLRHISLSPTQRVLANVSTTPVEKMPLTKMIDVVGIVDVAETQQATVSARFRGRIEKQYANFTGDYIEKGKPLVELYSPDLVTSQQEFILALDGNQQNLVDGMRERLRLNYGMTDQQIRNLESTRSVQTAVQFYSPISGTVVLKQVQEGQYVDEGTVLYQLANLSKVWIYLDVYEKDVQFVKKGQIVHIKTDAYPDEEFTGRVTFIDPVMNPETRTVRIRSEFDNRHGMLKPKMFVKAQLHMEGRKTLTVPSSAIMFTGKRTVVWVETQKNTFEPRDVVLGQSANSEYEIVSGLEEGEMIAVSGGFLIDSESALQQPGSADPHAGHGTEKTESMSTAGSTSTEEDHSTHKMESASNTIKITVDGGYDPEVVHVKLGQEVKLQFHRVEDSECTSEVVFEELNIRKKLPAFKTTTVIITPKKLGEISFACGMGMVHGKLIVER